MSYEAGSGEPPEEPVHENNADIVLDLGGIVLYLSAQNSKVMSFHEGGGEFDYLLHRPESDTGPQNVYMFFNELDREIEDDLRGAMEALNFINIYRKGVDPLTMKYYRRTWALKQAGRHDD